jgi:hypothetical protein
VPFHAAPAGRPAARRDRKAGGWATGSSTRCRRRFDFGGIESVFWLFFLSDTLNPCVAVEVRHFGQELRLNIIETNQKEIVKNLFSLKGSYIGADDLA